MLQSVFTSIQNVFRYHKLKIIAIFFFTGLFAVIIFPYSDLADLMTVKVAEATNNQVYIQADSLKFSVSPGLGAKMENVVLETPTMPSIQASSLAVSPSLLSLITMKPSFSARAEDIFKGNVDLSISPGGKTKAGNDRQDVQITAQQIALNSLSEFMRGMNMGDLRLQGALDLTSGVVIDPAFDDQPNGELNLRVSKFAYPARSIDMGLGPIQIPEVKLQEVLGKGTLKDGRLAFEQLQFGAEGDELNGTVTGDIGMNLRRNPTGVVPEFGSYNFQVALNVSTNFQKRASLFLMLADAYKVPTPTGFKYAFRVQAPNVYTPPRISAQ
jgi:type II secretion system protein N